MPNDINVEYKSDVTTLIMDCVQLWYKQMEHQRAQSNKLQLDWYMIKIQLSFIVFLLGVIVSLQVIRMCM